MREDLIAQLATLRRELNAIQARLTDTLGLAARLPLESTATVRCPHCGLDLPSERRREEHLENVHGDAEPNRR